MQVIAHQHGNNKLVLLLGFACVEFGKQAKQKNGGDDFDCQFQHESTFAEHVGGEIDYGLILARVQLVIVQHIYRSSQTN